MTKLLISLFFVTACFAGPGTYPQGDHVKLLKDKMEFKNSLTQIISGDSDDPSAVAKSADIGSLYLRDGTYGVYAKTSDGSNTDWVKLFNSSIEVDHDATTNFVANEHIDHTAVTITTGVGITGGGDISANRTFDFDLTSLPAATGADQLTDEIAVYNQNDTATGKIALSDVKTLFGHDAHNDLTGIQGGAAADYYHLTLAQATIATQAATAALSGYVNIIAQSFTGLKTFLSGVVINTTITGTAVLDEDNMVSNSDTKIATQQSIKAYVDGQAQAVVYTTSVSYTVLDADGYGAILVDDTSTDRTITLPTASANSNRVITIKNTSTDKGKVTVDGEGAETIDGYATIDLDFKGAFLEIQCDGTSWSIISDGVTRDVKQYSLTVTGTNWTTTRAVGISYQTLDGTWRFRFNIKGVYSVGTASSSLTVSGVTFKTGIRQGVSAQDRTGANTPLVSYTDPAASTIASGLSGATTGWLFFGDVELDSKPTFVE